MLKVEANLSSGTAQANYDIGGATDKDDDYTTGTWYKFGMEIETFTDQTRLVHRNSKQVF